MSRSLYGMPIREQIYDNYARRLGRQNDAELIAQIIRASTTSSTGTTMATPSTLNLESLRSMIKMFDTPPNFLMPMFSGMDIGRRSRRNARRRSDEVHRA